MRHLIEWLAGNDWLAAVGLVINGINFGTYNPIRKPETGQMLGDVEVLRKTVHAHAMGGQRTVLPVRHWLDSPLAVSGNAAHSQGANEIMSRWLEEMATNPDVQPLLVQWSNVRALPQDGWWFLKAAKPDYQWTGGGPLPVDMEFHFRAPKSAPLFIGYDGGTLPSSNFTQPGTNLIAYPPNSTAIITATRAGSEGPMPYVLSPAQKPVTLQGSSTVSDLFKGGCRVYDMMGPYNQVPTITTKTLWHTIGTEAGTDNSIAYWNNVSGGSYASHLITLLRGAGMTGGSLDWDDGTWATRFKWVTNTAPAIFCRLPSRASTNGGVLAWADSANFHMEVGFADAAPISTPFVPVNGTFYWMSIQMAGNIATAKLFNDSAGALGGLVATLTFDASVGHSTALAPRGCVGVGEVGGTADNCQFGGAFANVMTFSGPMLSAWNIGQGTGESAFALSKAQSNAGSYSLSVYNAAAGGQGFYARSVTHTATDTYTISAYCRGTGSPTNFGPIYGGNVPSLVIADSTWRLSTGTAAYTAGGWADQVALTAYGSGTYYFDDISLIDNTLSSMLFAEGCEPASNAAWVEVFGLEHTFVGSVAVTNGLLLLVFSLAGGLLNAFVWNTALASPGWNQVGSMDFLDSLSAVAVLQGVRLRKLGNDSVQVDCQMYTPTANPHAGLVTVRLDRGQYNFRLMVRPETFANTNAALLRWVPAVVGNGIVYNPTAVGDQGLGASSLAASTDAGFAAAFIPNSGAQWLYGFLHPKQLAQQPGFTGTVLNLGDTAAPAQRQTVTYGFFIVPFGDSIIGPLHLKAEAESGVLDAGWSSQANAGASGGNEAKCASGTVSGRAANGLYTKILPAGKYNVWARVKVASAASAVAQMQFGLFNNTASAWAPVGYIRSPNQFTTSYVFYLIGQITANGTDTYQIPGIAKTTATTDTDWFVDEFILAPITLPLNVGPQEQFQQWVYERSTQYPVT